MHSPWVLLLVSHPKCIRKGKAHQNPKKHPALWALLQNKHPSAPMPASSKALQQSCDLVLQSHVSTILHANFHGTLQLTCYLSSKCTKPLTKPIKPVSFSQKAFHLGHLPRWKIGPLSYQRDLVLQGKVDEPLASAPGKSCSTKNKSLVSQSESQAALTILSEEAKAPCMVCAQCHPPLRVSPTSLPGQPES
jgi:hypothetical protein